MQMRSQQVQVNGVSLFSEAFGDPSHPTLLLIMGATASSVWWPEEFCRALAGRSLHVIRYDHRDTGRSTSYAPGQPAYTVEDLANDAVGLLDAHGVAQAHLMGMSLGGYLSQLVAVKYPARVRSLALLASEPLATAGPQEQPAMDERILEHHAAGASLDWADREAVIEFQVAAWRLLAGSAHRFDEAVIRALAAADYDRTPDLRTTFNHALLREPANWTDKLSKIQVPTLVIHGTEDPVLPYAKGLALVEAIANARLLALAGVGHELHPRDWSRIIDEVVRNCGTQA